MSRPALSPAFRARYADSAPSNSTTGRPLTPYSVCPGQITRPMAGSQVIVPLNRLYTVCGSA